MAILRFEIGSVLIFLIQIFVLLVLIRVIFMWLYGPFPTNSFSRLMWVITEPVLGPIRRRLPLVAGLDLSPIVVWVAAGILIGLVRFIL